MEKVFFDLPMELPSIFCNIRQEIAARNTGISAPAEIPVKFPSQSSLFPNLIGLTPPIVICLGPSAFSNSAQARCR